MVKIKPDQWSYRQYRCLQKKCQSWLYLSPWLWFLGTNLQWFSCTTVLSSPFEWALCNPSIGLDLCNSKLVSRMKRNFTNIAKLGVAKIFDPRSSSQHGFDLFSALSLTFLQLSLVVESRFAAAFKWVLGAAAGRLDTPWQLCSRTLRGSWCTVQLHILHFWTPVYTRCTHFAQLLSSLGTCCDGKD